MAIRKANNSSSRDENFNVEDVLDYIIINCNQNPEIFGIRPTLAKFLDGAPTSKIASHFKLLNDLNELIVNYNYGTVQPGGIANYYIKTPYWDLAKKYGGHYKYQQLLLEKNKDDNFQKLQDRAIKELDYRAKSHQAFDYDTLKKQRNILFFIAVFTLIVSVVSVWIALYKKC